MKRLKLYVWYGVLADWHDGIAFALASNAEEAKKLLMARSGGWGIGDEKRWDGVKFDGVGPTEHTEPMAFHQYGGS